VAGLAFLLYIAADVSAMVLTGRAGGGAEIAGKLAGIAQHLPEVRLAIVLYLFGSFMALVLAVTLYAITRDQDHDLALLGLTFRVGEGVIGGVSLQRSLGLLWLATADGPRALDAAQAHAFGTFLQWGQRFGYDLSSNFFGVGSLIFCWLLLRGRMIPMPLAWLGVAASVIWVLGSPLQTVGALPESLNGFVLLPMAAFEIPFGLWLIAKGVRPVAEARAA
jgi:hypothetical protein